MQVVKITELVYSDPRPKTPEEGRQKHNAILAQLNTPVFLGGFNGLQYDTKTDRYVASFSLGDGKKLTLKASNDVAEFLATHATGGGYWQGRMGVAAKGERTEAGALVDLNLIQA